ncbi:protein TonB [Actimicrobium sp. GrIS 1.19]|uniref:energy transducer TonB n=1 Tax=Actimicrobium sp. GrIS 1.19 TaxID=3071708 RepID=UPI002E038A9E|nr:protein TonB [Actimicrobium sp. GrIS 1.19]
MTSQRAPLVLIATVLLHVGAILFLTLSHADRIDLHPDPKPVFVRIVPTPTPPRPQPVAVAAPAAKPAPAIVRPTIRPSPAPRVVASASVDVPVRAPEPATASAPPAPEPVAPVPAPQPPVKTAVSLSASYAAANRKPVYPAMSRRYEEQGTVVLRVLVNPDGSAGAVQIKTSSGYPLLDAAARDAVQSWRFQPATMDGKAVAEWYQIPIPFRLQE